MKSELKDIIHDPKKLIVGRMYCVAYEQEFWLRGRIGILDSESSFDGSLVMHQPGSLLMFLGANIDGQVYYPNEDAISDEDYYYFLDLNGKVVADTTIDLYVSKKKS